MSDRDDLLEWLSDALQDLENVVTSTQLDLALDLALMQYTQRRPNWQVEELTGNGSTTTWDVPDLWVPQWSWIDTVHEVVGSSRPTPVDGSCFWVEQTTDGYQWRAIGALASGITWRVRYAGLHTATNSATSVPEIHQAAVAMLGAANGLELFLATRAASAADPTLGADTTDHAARSERYATRAAELRKLFEALVPAWQPRRLQIVRG